MKRSLRVTLLTILLGLTLFTVLAVGISGYYNLSKAAGELTNEVLKQTAARVDQRVDEVVKMARRQTSIMTHLFAAGEFEPEDFVNNASYWHEIVDTMKTMSGIYFIRAEDGAAIYVQRSPIYNDRITVREVKPTSPDKRLLYTYSIRDHRMRPFREGGAVPARLVGLGVAGPLHPAATLFPWQDEPGTRISPLGFDARSLPSFYAAAKGRDSVWTDTFMFFGEEGDLAYPGLSYATPIFHRDGSLLGVFGISFNIFTLCDFLKELDLNTKGYAFVIEQRRDGERRLIAHPRRQLILDERSLKGNVLHTELKPLTALTDKQLLTFMEQVPPELNVHDIPLTRVEFRLTGEDFLGAFRGLEETHHAPPWIIGMIIPEAEIMGEARKHLAWSVLIAVGVLVFALLLSIFISGQVARPLEEVVHDVERISKLELDPGPQVRSIIYEVDRLTCATEDMKTSLRSFRKYVPADLVACMLATGREAELGGERRRLTIYFSDIANFTTISEATAPEKLVDHLGEYLHALSDQILTSGGTVDKYIGDAIMAFWGAPIEMPQHALAACTAAIRNQQILMQLRKRWAAEGKPLFYARIGINTGEVVVGNIGSPKRLNYTVIGDAVNLASRLEGLNKFYGTSTLITEMTYEEVRSAVVARPLDWVSVKGKTMGVLVYELLGLRGEAPPEQEELAERFGTALQSYRRQEWKLAQQQFDAVLSCWPNDAPAGEMKRRCQLYLANPPGPGWDGVHHMQSK